MVSSIYLIAPTSMWVPYIQAHKDVDWVKLLLWQMCAFVKLQKHMAAQHQLAFAAILQLQE